MKVGHEFLQRDGSVAHQLAVPQSLADPLISKYGQKIRFHPGCRIRPADVVIHLIRDFGEMTHSNAIDFACLIFKDIEHVLENHFGVNFKDINWCERGARYVVYWHKLIREQHPNAPVMKIESFLEDLEEYTNTRLPEETKKPKNTNSRRFLFENVPFEWGMVSQEMKEELQKLQSTYGYPEIDFENKKKEN